MYGLHLSFLVTQNYILHVQHIEDFHIAFGYLVIKKFLQAFGFGSVIASNRMVEIRSACPIDTHLRFINSIITLILQNCSIGSGFLERIFYLVFIYKTIFIHIAFGYPSQIKEKQD